ncbi:universal stress protein [Azospirillum halopraeferens]|uniref:universal stress protein n=1 Tax=Azospirillum halopraeferens TaxID=34010 RepID=UPI000410A64C|nr:universal stress protein [Azospirillum halopraeferens]
MKILVPVDGSEPSLHAVDYIAKTFARTDAEVFLLNVQHPLPSAVSDFVGEAERHAYHEEEGRKALDGARQRLSDAGIAHHDHIALGSVAETIVRHATELGCTQIVIGSRGLSPLPNLLLGSTTTRVLNLAEVPVTVVK